MSVVNVHERVVQAPIDGVGRLIDSLASRSDRLWPSEQWPPMRLDRPLQVGAEGGHGPIGYAVERCEPGRRVRFRFTRPRGFSGWHGFEVEAVSSEATRLRHVLEMECHGWARLSWPLVFRPLHDALIEDALSKADAALTGRTAPQRWSLWVRVLRGILGRGRRSPGRRTADGH